MYFPDNWNGGGWTDVIQVMIFPLLGKMKFCNNSFIEKHAMWSESSPLSPLILLYLEQMCAGECTWAPVWLSPAVVVVAALSQHAVGAVRERGEEASWGRRLQARGAVGAWYVGRRTGLWKRHHTGAAWADSYGSSNASWLSVPQLLFSYQLGHRHVLMRCWFT